MVEKGKPAAMLPIQDRYVNEAIEIVTENYKLFYYIKNLSDDWKALWVYKYQHILEIIKSSQQEPKTVFDHWVLGKLFGYEESAIRDYLNQF